MIKFHIEVNSASREQLAELVLDMAKQLYVQRNVTAQLVRHMAG